MNDNDEKVSNPMGEPTPNSNTDSTKYLANEDSGSTSEQSQSLDYPRDNQEQGDSSHDYNYLAEIEPPEPPTSVSFLMGIIGAFLGAVIGSIPWLVVLNAGWLIGWLAFLTGYVSFYGYKLFKGPKNHKFAVGVIWSLSLLVILAMNFVSIAFALQQEDYPVTMENMIIVTQYLIEDGSFLKDLGISLGIGVLGLLGINRNIATYTKGIPMPKRGKKSDKVD